MSLIEILKEYLPVDIIQYVVMDYIETRIILKSEIDELQTKYNKSLNNKYYKYSSTLIFGY